jgi:hypothetical protein
MAYVVGIVAGGCGNDNNTFLVTTPRGAVEVTETNGWVTSITFVSTNPFDPFVATVTPEQAAASVAAAARTFFQPPSCVQATASGNTVTFNLSNCTGPLGSVGISGTITSTYVAQASGYQVTIKSSNLTANNSAITLDVVVVFTGNGNARQATITNNTSARNTNGDTVAQTQTATLTWNKGETCATLNTTGTLQINSTSMNQAFNNILLCSGRCPTGTVMFSNSQNQTLTLTLNGSTTAAIADNAGHNGTVQLLCGQ